VKRIVLCADGTWNNRDQVDKDSHKRRPTNVTKLARAVRPRSAAGIDQIVCYHDGIGVRGGFDRFTGGAFGRGMEVNVRTLYRFVLYNYEPGDELFFFGFSRGAFTVRTLAGFMRQVGLVEKDDDYYVPDIYACYESSQGPGSKAWEKAFHNVRGTRPCPPIRLIGVWDTVGALGAPGFLGQLFNRNKYRYHDIGLNSSIEAGYHAIALDERRKAFAPNVWHRPPDWHGSLEQAWFPGVHSDVGGGYTPDGLANEALHWMVEKAEAAGLDVDGQYLKHFRPCFNGVRHESMTTLYRLLGAYERPIGASEDGESVHQCALDRMNLPSLAYAPRNLTARLGLAAAPLVSQTNRVARGPPC
jgi:uncharacterized protein (DUF2235 family)